jgi:hypothetical protein
MWQNILHINKEYFTTSQKMNPCGMRIFVKYLIMWHGICYKFFLLFIWTLSPIHRLPLIIHSLTLLGNSCLMVLQMLFNKQLCWGRSVVENSFGILKKTFRELILKTNLHVLFILVVVVCCCIIYNMIIDGKDFDMDEFFIYLKLENVVNRWNFHVQKKGGYDLGTTENLDNT